MYIKEFRQRFRELVDPLGKTKWKCSKMIGISYQTFLDIYGKGKVPYMRQLMRIADYFDVSLDYLLGRTDTK